MEGKLKICREEEKIDPESLRKHLPPPRLRKIIEYTPLPDSIQFFLDKDILKFILTKLAGRKSGAGIGTAMCPYFYHYKGSLMGSCIHHKMGKEALCNSGSVELCPINRAINQLIKELEK